MAGRNLPRLVVLVLFVSTLAQVFMISSSREYDIFSGKLPGDQEDMLNDAYLGMSFVPLDKIGGGNVLREIKEEPDRLSSIIRNSLGKQNNQNKKLSSILPLEKSEDGFEKRNFDEIDRAGFRSMGKRNFDEIDRSGFGGMGKRNFDEIDRAGFRSMGKRNFDEIDRAGFRSMGKRNFDEIDRAGFRNMGKRNFDEIDRSGFRNMGKRNFDEIDKGGFGMGKRNFDEIDRSGFHGLGKRNFDEIDRSGFGNMRKREFNEIDRSGFGRFVKRNSHTLENREFTIPNFSSFSFSDLKKISDGSQIKDIGTESIKNNELKNFLTNGKRNFDEIDKSGFSNIGKKNFDEIDRSGFGNMGKRNFDEIDKSGFSNIGKKNFDEIDKSGFRHIGKRQIKETANIPFDVRQNQPVEIRLPDPKSLHKSAHIDVDSLTKTAKQEKSSRLSSSPHQRN